ncbi:MAG: alpha/beta hydrolase [Erythrobacter sp.]|jgi:pimeloyl-ACP methyl ester carboxylesterase|nr:alpha/beta hydrolase [Erythrobacter sp.]
MKWALRIVGALVALLVVAFFVFRTPDTDPETMRAKYAGPPSQFVEIADGVRIHLRDEGPRDALPIVLLHGSNADLFTWEPWVEALSNDYRIIRFDQVGHGLTGPDPAHDYSRDNFTSDIREVANAMGLERFVLGGSSMGGKHAMAFAAAYPERILGLILVDASGSPQVEAPPKDDEENGNIGFAIAQTPGISWIAEHVTPRALIEQSLEQSVSVAEIVDDAMIDRYWEMLRYPGNRAATMARFASDYEPLAPGEFAAIDVPVLLLWGEEDRLIPLGAGLWLDETLPRSQLIVYPQTGHLPQEERANRSSADVRRWLETLSTPRR